MISNHGFPTTPQPHRRIYGSGTGSTRHRYGMSRCGYGAGKPDLRVTRSKPYLCRLYISLCEDQFRDEQMQIHWALSFMKSGRAALYANRILRKEASEDLPVFLSWQGFERDFSSKFCPKNEATVALTKLESSRYYQG